MKRTKQTKKPDAILTGDWHLREDQPTCRTDNYQMAQWKKVEFIRHLQLDYDCPVLHSGDLFNHWKPSPSLLSKTIIALPNQFHTILGNHDLPQHNLDLIHKCGVFTLRTAGALQILPGCHWGEVPTDSSISTGTIDITSMADKKQQFIDGYEILVWHVMTFQGKKPWPGCTDPMAASLLRKYPEYDLILTGHNHQSFTEKHEGRLLVNPGSLTRHKADQIDHRPCVYLWYADTNTAVPVYLPIEQGVISRDHIEHSKERNDRIDAFISKLDDDWEAAVSFEENLERFEKTNKVRKSVMEIVHKAIES